MFVRPILSSSNLSRSKRDRVSPRRSGRLASSTFFLCPLLFAPLLFALGCSNAVLSGGPGGSEDSKEENPSQKPNGPGEGPVDEQGVDGIGWSSRYPRLSHAQWENTVRDLLRLPASSGLSATFSLDPDDSRFDTAGATLISSNLWLDYQRAAETIAEDVTDDPALLSNLVPGASDKSTFLLGFLPRALRRAPSADEIEAYGEVFDEGVASGVSVSDFASGVRLVVTAALQSPHFLYRPETSTETDGDKIWLSASEIANRLSFSLWNTMPSDELLSAAQNGELSDEASVLSWAEKMLNDERAVSTLISFHQQFFHTKDYGTIAKNQTLFPGFTTELAPTLREEARLFFHEVVVQNDGGIAQLMTSPVSFVNAQTAPYYDLGGTFGDQLTRVTLDPDRRSGILTQLGFLSRLASQTQSDPILRGVHISLDFLCSDLPAPPADIPPLPDFEENQTNRERVELSTSESPCNNCHETLINPLGFAFEHYDAVGAFRETDNGKPVDATSDYELDGEFVSYDGAVELTRLLAESPSLHRCYVKAWLEYLMGRPPVSEEDTALGELSEISRTQGAASTLLSSLVALDTFRARPKDSFSDD